MYVIDKQVYVTEKQQHPVYMSVGKIQMCVYC
nr:MAG TPA: hypothetical protein [Caudoviricetes sp.]